MTENQLIGLATLVAVAALSLAVLRLVLGVVSRYATTRMYAEVEASAMARELVKIRGQERAQALAGPGSASTEATRPRRLIHRKVAERVSGVLRGLLGHVGRVCSRAAQQYAATAGRWLRRCPRHVRRWVLRRRRLCLARHRPRKRASRRRLPGTPMYRRQYLADSGIRVATAYRIAGETATWVWESATGRGYWLAGDPLTHPEVAGCLCDRKALPAPAAA